jgi:glycosyltransferase involved in cell wall biosynthesis
MKILFDFRWSGEHGIGRFARELDQRLNLPHLNIDGNPASPVEPLRLMLMMQFRTPKDALVFSPGYNAPLFNVRPYVFTIMDLNHIDRPENSNRLKRLYYRLIIRRAARKARRVLTISEYSRKRIIAWTGVDAGRVVNVGCGVSSNYHSSVEPYAPGYPYLLCVSNRKAHKNEHRVIEAFSKAPINSDIRLVFTGHENETVSKLLRKHHIENRTIFAGTVPETELPGLYRGAIALVFPSLYEGFGLPVVEAMSCGTPVITSNCSSLPEVAGEAGLLIDPLSVEEIASSIQRLVEDKELRVELSKKGLERAKLFSWDKTAKLIWDVLAEAAFDKP